jgi:hypothetical protein
MFQRVFTVALIAMLAAPLAAQQVSSLKVRVDRSTDASDPDDTPELKVVAMGKGVRVTGGPAGVFWNATDTATGSYTAKATFNLQQPSNHNNFYGIVFGGSELAGAKQSYTYFMVSQNGGWLLKGREGDQSPTLQRGTHGSIAKPDASGKSVNVVEVRVAGDTITYVVNGQTVHTMPKGTTKTDGLAGFRVNHMLDVQVEGFQVTKG